MTAKDTILYTLRFSGGLVGMMTKDLTPEELHHRVAPEANPAAWLLGHLVLTERRALSVLDADLPPIPDGFEDRFGQKNDAPRATDFGDVSGLTDLFARHRDALVAAVEATDDARLDEPLANPNPRFGTIGELLAFFPIHVSTHMGQISTIRRTLGKPPLF